MGKATGPQFDDDEKYGLAAAEEKHDGMSEAEHFEAQAAQVKGASATANMKDSLNRAFTADGIEITDVFIKDVDLPDDIQSNLEKKTNVDSRNKEQRMQQKKDMQSTAFDETIKKLKQKNSELTNQARADMDRDVNVVSVKLDQAKTELANRLQEIRRKTEIEVESVRQDTELAKTESDQKVKATMTAHEAEAKAEAQRIETETEAYVKTTIAVSELEAAKFKAKASILISEAEGEIASQVGVVRGVGTGRGA